MKKFISLFLMAVLMVGLTACKEEDIEITEEDIADAIVENWDGELNHLDLVFENLDLEDSMVQTTEFNFELLEDGVTHYVNETVTDTYVYLETGTVMQRNISVDFDGTVTSFDVIVKEVSTGIIVYVNIEYIKTLLVEEGADIIPVLDMLGIEEDWLMFKFDDSLDNIIELEVMKDLFVDAFYERFGPEFFYDLQDEVEIELGFDLDLYGVDFGVFIDHLVAAEYAEAELMLEDIDEDGLLLALDFSLLVPEIVIILTENQVELDLAGFNTVGRITDIESMGTELFLEDLTDNEIVILLNVLVDVNAEPGDPDLSDIYEAYAAGTLNHYLVMMFLDDPEVEAGLREIPGFDFDGFYSTMDLLDYDAMYLETVDGELLFDAIYAGQDAYDIFVAGLTTAPESAKVLGHLSPIVLAIESLMVIIDDIDYGIENLDMFEEYFDMQYYIGIGVLELDVQATDEYAIETTVTLVGSAYSELFEDLIADVYWYLDGFESFTLPYVEHLNCPTSETCEEFAEYNEVIDNLNQLGNMYFTATYDPANPGEVVMHINFTEFVNALIEMDEYTTNSSVVDMSITVTIQENGAVTIPEVVADMNQVAEDFAKVSLTIMAYDLLRDVGEYYIDNGGEVTLDFGDTRALDTFGDYVRPSFAFDANESYVSVGGSIINPDYSIQLYWHDGTKVFVEPLSVSFLDDFMELNTPTRTMYLSLLSKVDAENFSITKLLLVYVFMDFEFAIGAGAEEPEIY